MYKRGFIKKVDKGSIAEEAGIEKGDVLLSINHQNITDIFDYRFLVIQPCLTLNVQKPDGEEWEIEFEKDEYEDLGLEFEPAMIDQEKSCNNKCIFCFIDQLPPKMRDTLYFKDDDARLSFLTGNYVTLTNTKDDELKRIIAYKLSPVNLSVHTTDPELRCKLLNNKRAGNIMNQIKELVDNDIIVNCQLVLCKGINDGVYLKKSIEALSGLYPGVESISVVPVGLTAHRDKLYALEMFNAQDSNEIIQTVSEYQEKNLQKTGSRIVFCADEFYVHANREIPKYSAYEAFPQLENGVGLLALFQKEFEDALMVKYKVKKQRTISIGTGKAAETFINGLCEKIMCLYDIHINVYAIDNRFFGTTVDVTGLLTGTDIMEQLKNEDLGMELFLSKSMFKSGEDILLDNVSIEDLEKALHVKVTVVNNDGHEFLKYILGVN